MHLAIRCLETILDYELSSMQAKAVKVMYLYNESVQKIFPDYKVSYPKGDPRKSYTWKVCYKLVQETQNKIEECDYPLYIIAQLDIIRRNTERYGRAAHVSPTCLIGPKAWNRWLVWKNIYDKKIAQKQQTAEDVGVEAHRYERVIGQIKQDKSFLSKKLEESTKEAIEQAVRNRAVLRWIATKQLSPYYALLSPILNRWVTEHNLTLGSMFNIDFDFYQPGITPQVTSYFHAEFPHEI